MAISVGLTLYNMGARRETRPSEARPARPSGRLVWLHAPDAECLGGLAELGRRLVEEDAVSVVLTGPPGLQTAKGIILTEPPLDTPTEAREFLNFWAPELVIFAEGELRPATLHEAALRQIPALMVDARRPHLPADREGWYPGLVRAALAEFRCIHLVDPAAHRDFRKAGAEAASLRISGRLEEAPLSLPYVEAERAALARLLAARPVWLAISVPEAEEEAVIAAHRRALALSHRLLLILVPEDLNRAEALALRLEEQEGWQVARRSQEQEPDPEVEVFLPDQPGENGLWYRLAPVTFLGGSFLGEGCNRNPLEPATTGSAILFGPRTGAFGPAYARLGPALAARMIGSAEDLALALADLLSPDRAARQAHAAWSVLSDGSEVTEAVLRTIRDIMDGTA